MYNTPQVVQPMNPTDPIAIEGTCNAIGQFFMIDRNSTTLGMSLGYSMLHVFPGNVDCTHFDVP